MNFMCTLTYEYLSRLHMAWQRHSTMLTSTRHKFNLYTGYFVSRRLHTQSVGKCLFNDGWLWIRAQLTRHVNVHYTFNKQLRSNFWDLTCFPSLILCYSLDTSLISSINGLCGCFFVWFGAVIGCEIKQRLGEISLRLFGKHKSRF